MKLRRSISRRDEEDSWPERKARAEQAIERLRQVPDDAKAAKIVIAASADPMWEVRKLVADALVFLTEDVFQQLLLPLSHDKNALVCRAARKSAAKRLAATQLPVQVPGTIQRTLERIDQRHGPEARLAAYRLAQKFVKLHLRNAVHDLRSILTYFREDQQNLWRSRQGHAFLARLADMMDCYSGDLVIVRKSENIGKIVQEAVASAVDQIEKQGRSTAQVEIQIEVGPGLTASVSRYHFMIALTNLIKNAIESHIALTTELGPGHVTIQASRERSDLIVTIADTGHGMSYEDLVDLMEYIPGMSSKGERGSGFGVPIAHLYIEAHEGTLEFASAVGKGTTATIRIPYGCED